MTPSKKPAQLSNSLSILAVTAIVCLIVIAVSSVTHTSLALKDNSQGNSGVVRQHCLNGLENAAVEAGVCSINDLQRIGNIFYIRETEGIKAAKDACFTQMSLPGCKGLCVAAVNCYDIE